MESNRQKLDQWVRRDRRRLLRDLILAAVPLAVALGAALLTWVDRDAGSHLVQMLKLPDQLLAWIVPILIAIAALQYINRVRRQRRTRDPGRKDSAS